MKKLVISALLGQRRSFSTCILGRPHHRYSIVHLNEKGFHARNGKFIRPKGFGAIDKALRTAEKEFYKTVQEEVEKLL